MGLDAKQIGNTQSSHVEPGVRSRADVSPRALFLAACCVSAFAHCLSAQCPDGTPPPCAGARLAQPTLLVMPFENRSADTGQAYLAATLTEDLTAALARTRGLRLLSSGASRRSATYVLVGSIRRTGDSLHATATLERAQSGAIVWTSRVNRTSRELADLPDYLAAEVLRGMGRRPAQRAARAGPRTPTNPAVYDLYLRGRHLIPRRSQADLARSVSLLSAAVSHDTGFAPGWAALARAYHFAYRWRFRVPGAATWDELLAQELRASQRAIELDSASSEAWLTRAVVSEDVDPTSRAASIRALRRALAIDSLNAAAWAQLGVALGESGDYAAALASARRAVAVEPGGADVLVWMANLHYWLRQYDSAAVWADSAIAADPTFLQAYRSAGSVALARRRFDEAEARFAAAARVGPGPERFMSVAALAAVASSRGDTARGRELMRTASAATDSSELSLHGAVFMAWGFAALGDAERALAWLERFQPRGDLHFQQHLRGDAPLDPLRSEPRFRALLEGR